MNFWISGSTSVSVGFVEAEGGWVEEGVCDGVTFWAGSLGAADFAADDDDHSQPIVNRIRSRWKFRLRCVAPGFRKKDEFADRRCWQLLMANFTY